MHISLRIVRLSWIVALAGIAPAFGDSIYSVQKETIYLQSSTSAPTSPDSFNFNARINPNPTDGFDGGTVVGPAGFGTQNLMPIAPPGTVIFFDSDMATQFGAGSYEFLPTDSGNAGDTADVTVDDSTESFPDAIPALSGASYTALQNMDPTQALTVFFNTFDAAGAPFTSSNADFAVMNLSTNHIDFTTTLAPGAGQATIGANTLAPGTQYQFLLVFANVDQGGSGAALTQLFNEDITEGTFQTASPEPPTAVLAIPALMLMVWWKRRVIVSRQPSRQ